MELSDGIKQNIKNVPGFDFTFISPIYDHYIPLQEVGQSLARVIFLFTSAEATCLAFHEGMIYPKYQWVLIEDDFISTSFSNEEKFYFCTEEDMSTVLNGSINLVWSLEAGDDDLVSTEYEKRV